MVGLLIILILNLSSGVDLFVINMRQPPILAIIILVTSIAARSLSEFPSPKVLSSSDKSASKNDADALIDLYQEFLDFLKKYDKSYDKIEEMNLHFKIYCQNVKKIEEHNKSNSSYKQGINKFTDMSDDEFEHGYVMHLDMDKLKRPTKPNKPEAGSTN